MWGTVVNALAILAGTALGLLLRHGLPARVKETVMHAVGLGVLYIGFSMAGETRHVAAMLISLVAGGALGEALALEGRLNRAAERVEERLAGEGGGLARGFVTATLIYCVGAMAVMGALEGGLMGRYNILYAKSILDGVTSAVLASTLGQGVGFSALAVLVYQGTITLLAGQLQPLAMPTVLAEVTATGGLLILGIGLNMLEITRIRVANMLPALLVAGFIALVMVRWSGFLPA